jgi:succinate dehydrogenase hydrophobic anchor subunit
MCNAFRWDDNGYDKVFNAIITACAFIIVVFIVITVVTWKWNGPARTLHEDVVPYNLQRNNFRIIIQLCYMYCYATETLVEWSRITIAPNITD